MLKSRTRWRVEQPAEELAIELSKQLNITPLVAKLLVNRGIYTVESARSFLFIEENDFYDPFLMKDMEKAVKRIHQAIDDHEKIAIYGDYDADGVSSTTVLMETLKKLSADCFYYIPNRFTEGYGPNEQAFRHLKETGASLIISVDTGISALHEAEVAMELGMDYIITDHHEPGPQLPNAYAIIHPKLEDSTYPFRDLAGVGVAFKLAHALLGEVPEDLLEIAAIGTIADLVPLHGENRLIAARGIQKMRSTSRPGLLSLFKVAGLDITSLNEDSIGFGIGPRINAAGRLGDASPAVELLLTEDFETAKEIAAEIDAMNKERQILVSEIAEEAIKEVEDKYPIEENSVIVVGKEGWNSGVIGIVASKLVEKFYRPAIVLSFDQEKGVAKGSARSIEGFDLYKNLSLCKELLPHFGGHPMAAGMTLKLEDVDELRSRLNDLAKKCLTEEDFVPISKLDLVTPLEDVTLQSIEEMERLSPFGIGNPKPKIMIQDVKIHSIRKIGADQNHMKLMLEDKGYTLDGVGFGLGELADHISPLATISVIGELAINEWNNMRKPQIFLQDISVNHWQLFDIRGTRKLTSTLKQLPKESLKLIVFQDKNVEKLGLKEYKNEIVIIRSIEDAQNADLQNSNVVLVDLPSSFTILNALLKNKKPSRIYSHFYQENQTFFSTMPTREHFKWLYGFIKKKGKLDLNKHGDDIVKYKGWSRDSINFLVQVFFELNFVTIENGVISINEKASKRDFDESPSYRKKKEQFQLENELLYSSYGELYKRIQTILSESAQFEEEIKQWI